MTEKEIGKKVEPMGSEGKRTTEGAMKYQADQFFAHRMYYDCVFEQNEDMDYIFQWLLGQEANYGSSTGELFYAASQIEDGNYQSWREVFGELSERVQARAGASLAKGHKVSAREGFLRASNYYRITAVQAEQFVAEDYVKRISRSRAVFHKACPLFDPPIEPIKIPFHGKSLPGYFWKVADDGRKRKTLIMIGGGETVIEDMFFYLGPHAVRHGYNFVTADIPGQGMTPEDGFPFSADSEISMGAVLDYVLDRPEVDAERVASAGQSLGGYFVPRAACFDKRIKAVIGNALYYQPINVTRQHIVNADANAARRDNPMSGRWKWKWDIETPEDYWKKFEAMAYDPAMLTCPALSIIGEGEYQNKVLQQETETIARAAPHFSVASPPLNEGGAHHCTWENTYLAAQTTFDWLDELLD